MKRAMDFITFVSNFIITYDDPRFKNFHYAHVFKDEEGNEVLIIPVDQAYDYLSNVCVGDKEYILEDVSEYENPIPENDQIAFLTAFYNIYLENFNPHCDSPPTPLVYDEGRD